MPVDDPAPGEALGDAAPSVIVTTRPGWASTVAERLPNVVLPGHPELVRTIVPPEPTSLREAVGADTRRLLVSIGLIALLNGVFAVGGSMAASVAERTAELSLRRVLGARPSHLQRLVMTEAVIIGFAGGLAGLLVGLPVAAGVCLWQGWSPLPVPASVFAFPLIGTVTGAIAGAVPAWRAARIDPADGLRRE